jgi:hypothetical protein
LRSPHLPFAHRARSIPAQHGVPILCLHDNKGGEFTDNKWEAYMAEHGTCREHMVKATAQQNCVAERRNRTNEEHIIAMLNGAKLPLRFWGEALLYYNRVLNMSPSSAISDKTTPYELVHGRKPDYPMLCVFGCCAWAHVGKKERKHLENHPKPCVFLGLSEDFEGWKLWDPLTQGNHGGVIVSRDVIWSESEFPGASCVATDPITPRFGQALRPGKLEPTLEEGEDFSVPPASEGALPLVIGAQVDSRGDSNSSSSFASSSPCSSPEPTPKASPVPDA